MKVLNVCNVLFAQLGVCLGYPCANTSVSKFLRVSYTLHIHANIENVQNLIFFCK